MNLSPTAWLVIVVVLGVMLYYGFTRWRRRKPATEGQPVDQPGILRVPAGLSSAQTVPWRILTGGVLAAFGQVSILRGDWGLALVSLLVALVLLVPILLPWIPGEVAYQSPVAVTEPRREAAISSAQATAGRPHRPFTTRVPTMWRYWRYYTLSNLIHNTTPNFPAEVLAEMAKAKSEATAQMAQAEPAGLPSLVEAPPPTISSPGEAVSQAMPAHPTEPLPPATTAEVISPMASTTLAPEPLPASAPPALPASAPTQPATAPAPVPARGARLMTVSPLGDVIVIDAAQGLVHRFDPKGAPLTHLKLENLPKGITLNDLTFSPDGLTLYIYDAASESLQTVPLV